MPAPHRFRAPPLLRSVSENAVFDKENGAAATRNGTSHNPVASSRPAVLGKKKLGAARGLRDRTNVPRAATRSLHRSRSVPTHSELIKAVEGNMGSITAWLALLRWETEHQGAHNPNATSPARLLSLFARALQKVGVPTDAASNSADHMELWQGFEKAWAAAKAANTDDACRAVDEGALWFGQWRTWASGQTGRATDATPATVHTTTGSTAAATAAASSSGGSTSGGARSLRATARVGKHKFTPLGRRRLSKFGAWCVRIVTCCVATCACRCM